MFKKALSIISVSLLTVTLAACSSMDERMDKIENRTWEVTTPVPRTTVTNELPTITTEAEPTTSSSPTETTAETTEPPKIDPSTWDTDPKGGSSKGENKITNVSGERDEGFDSLIFSTDASKPFGYRIKYVNTVSISTGGEPKIVSEPNMLKIDMSGFALDPKSGKSLLKNKDLENLLNTSKLKNVEKVFLSKSSDGQTTFVAQLSKETGFNVSIIQGANNTRSLEVRISD